MPIEFAELPVAGESGRVKSRAFSLVIRRALFFLALAVLTLLIHGYHPFAEDGSLYVPAIKKQLNPGLYPHDAEFFLFPARLSGFASLVAGSVRLTRLPLEYMLLLWHLATTALFLAACWRLCRLCFGEGRTAVCGTLLMAALLTIPVAGTSLMVWDPYLTSRSFSTPMLLMAICCVLERKPRRAGLWLLAAALVHPLMAALGAVFLATLYSLQDRNWRLLAATGAGAAAAVTGGMVWAHFAVISLEYRAAVLTRSYFFLSRWTWYEIFGLIAPLVLFAILLRYARFDRDRRIFNCAVAAVLFGVFFLLVGVLINASPRFMVLAKFQPLRAFHLIYILLFLLPVTAFIARVTERRQMAAAGLLIAICTLMFVVQQRTFPASAHVEWPWSRGGNEWVQAFDWVRGNTPFDAVFALDGRYTETPGEDCQGFNARAERSSLADVSKDGGAAALFPSIAGDWARQTEATARIEDLSAPAEMQAIADAGASWVLLQRRDAAQLDCPYRNAAVAVCRIAPAGLTPAGGSLNVAHKPERGPAATNDEHLRDEHLRDEHLRDEHLRKVASLALRLHTGIAGAGAELKPPPLQPAGSSLSTRRE